MMTFDTSDIRREIDEARAQVEAIELVDRIEGNANPYLETLLGLAPAEALYDSWNYMRSEVFIYARNKLVEHYAWAIPDEEALAIVGETGKVVEIGAGGGYWAALLRQRGVEVHAYDPKPGETHWSHKVWTDVQRGKTAPAALHPDATLLLCWPSYTSRFAEIALRRYLRAGGERLVYIGEDDGGCCADEGFFELLNTMTNIGANYYIPSYPGMHDYVSVWEVKK